MDAYRKNLILVISEAMDKNKKETRDEHSLIRMPASSREAFSFPKSTVVVEHDQSAAKLNIHEAFASDIKLLKSKEKFTAEQFKQVGFVTTETFRKFSTSPGSLLTNNVFVGMELPPKPKPKAPIDILIGADPEFLLFDAEGNVVRANNIIPKEGLIGSDGAMVEIRPEPSECPDTLIKNMYTILEGAAKSSKIRDFLWKAAIYHKDNQRDYPVGGHIHIGNPDGINPIKGNTRNTLFAVLNKILDELLALPLIKLDGHELGKFRRSECQMAMGNHGYGYFGEWRTCNGRLEHRTLSGLWLMHPMLATCVIGTAKAIAEEVYTHLDNKNYESVMYKHPDIALNNYSQLYKPEFNDWEAIPIAADMQCTKPSSYMISMLNSSKDRSVTKRFMEVWYNKLKQLSTYKKYSVHIDKLYAILSLPAPKIHETGFDIKKNWLENKQLSI